VLDELVALVVSVLRLVLGYRTRCIALMHSLHTVVLLSPHIVVILTYVGSLGWVLGALAVVGTILVSATGSSTGGSRHLGAVKTRSVRDLVGSSSVLVRVGALIVLQLVLWVVISSASVLCGHSFAVTSLSMVLLI